MTNPPFRTEVRRLRGARIPGPDRRPGQPSRDDDALSIEIGAVVAQLDPIRSRSSLLASYAREASRPEPVRTAYAIRWVELGSGIPATGIARSRRRRVISPGLRATG